MYNVKLLEKQQKKILRANLRVHRLHTQKQIKWEKNMNKALSKIKNELLNDENKLEEYAINSRKYFINNFTIEKYIDEISNKMEELV